MAKKKKDLEEVVKEQLAQVDGGVTPPAEEPMSKVAYDHAQETLKIAEENPEALKIENQAALEQVEFASRYFRMYNKVFVNMINTMNKKAAARVITRLISYPLETPDKLTWSSKQEKDAFLIGNQLIETKYMLFKYVAMGEAEKAKLASQQNEKDKDIFKEKTEGEKVNG